MLRIPFFLIKTIKIFNNIPRRSLYLGCPNLSQTYISVLSNGLKVATEETYSPLACVSMYVLTGPRFENESLNGISHFLEHMCYKGARSMSKTMIDHLIHETGAKLTAHTSREYQYFSAVCPAEHVKQIVCLFSKIALVDLDFPYDDVQAEKEKIHLEAKDRENDPKSVVFDYLHQTAFQGTTLGQGVIGPTCNLNIFDACNASCFMTENYHPMRIVLASAGGVCHYDMCCIAESMFRCCYEPCCHLDDGPQRYTGSQIIYRNDSMPLAHVAIAVEAPGYLCSDYLPLYVANFLLDSWDRSCSRGYGHASYLARVSAIGGFCVKFEPFYIAYRDVGLWGMYYVSEKDEIDEMMLHVQDRWMNLCCSVTDNDVKRAINSAKLALAKNCDGVINSCHDIGKQVTHTSTRKNLDCFYHELEKITPETIKTAANTYIYDKCPVVAAVGPTEVLSEYTRLRAQMYWLRI